MTIQLAEVHDRLRDQLADLRTPPAGRPPVDPRAHCLAFCAALADHHGAEDAGLLPAIAAGHPELAGVVAELRRDHEAVAAILRRLDELRTGDSDDIRGELDGLAALLESHFGYEERKLAAALATMDPRGALGWL